MGSLRVGHDWATSLSLFTFMHRRRKWLPTPVFLPGESQGRKAWWAAVYGSHRVGHDWSDLAAAAAIFHYICICTCHIFIRFSVDGYLVCFHVLAIVNSAAMNSEVRVSFQSMFFSIGSFFFLSSWVYYSARAALKKDHKLSGLKNKKFIFS